MNHFEEPSPCLYSGKLMQKLMKGFLNKTPRVPPKKPYWKKNVQLQVKKRQFRYFSQWFLLFCSFPLYFIFPFNLFYLIFHNFIIYNFDIFVCDLWIKFWNFEFTKLMNNDKRKREKKRRIKRDENDTHRYITFNGCFFLYRLKWSTTKEQRMERNDVGVMGESHKFQR